MNPKHGDPVKESLYLEEDERIVGVIYQKPDKNDWLMLQSGFFFIVAKALSKK